MARKHYRPQKQGGFFSALAELFTGSQTRPRPRYKVHVRKEFEESQRQRAESMLPNRVAGANPVGYELSQHIVAAPVVHERTIVHDLPMCKPEPRRDVPLLRKESPDAEYRREPKPNFIPTPADKAPTADVPSAAVAAQEDNLITLLDKQLAASRGAPVIFPGQTGERYAIEKKLGQGGMGGVFIARKIFPDLELSDTIIDAVARGLASVYKGQPGPQSRGVIAKLDGWTVAELYKDLVQRKVIPDDYLMHIKRLEKEACDDPLNERGCLKVAASGKTMQTALRKEIAAASRVTTQFMAPIKAVTCHKETGAMGVFYSYVDGHNMHDIRHAFLSCGQLISPELLALWANHVAQGLLPFHEKGIVHGDLCDQNIAESKHEGCAKIFDFGMSGNRSKAEIGLIEGKPLYIPPDILDAATINYYKHHKIKISPEQLVAGDVWALGSLFYLLLTGIHPYADRRTGDDKSIPGYINWKKLISDRQTFRLLKAHEVCADVSEPLSEIVHSMLDPDWTKRPTIKQFESLIKTHYLFNGFMGTGVSMQSWRDALARLYPAPLMTPDGKKRPRYTAVDLAKDVRQHPALANLKQVLLGSYRIPFYEEHNVPWKGDNGWARTFDLKRYPDIENPDVQKRLYARLRNDLPSAQRQIWPTGIDYSMRSCLRTVEQAIGPRCGDLLYEMFQKRLTDNAFKDHHSDILRSLSVIDQGAKAYDVFRELAIDVLAKNHKPVTTKDGTDITRAYLKTKADRYLFDMYAQAIELHPERD